MPKISLFYYDTLDGGRTFSRFLRLSLHAGRMYAKVMVQKINLTPSSSTPKFFCLPAFLYAPPPPEPAGLPACQHVCPSADLYACMVRACVRGMRVNLREGKGLTASLSGGRDELILAPLTDVGY